ncbi:DnaD domain protein [Enterococcus sp. LJL128]
MAGGGWIKLYRSIQDHWVWDNPVYLKWWLDLLLMANHKPNKVLVNGKIETIDIGERLTSEMKLSARWGASRKSVSKFLTLLENEGMITVSKSRQKGTTYKVLKYKDYQQVSDPVENNKGHNNGNNKNSNEGSNKGDNGGSNEGSINKNEKKEKNEKNDKNIPSLTPPIDKNNINIVLVEIEKNFGRPLSPVEIEMVTSWQLTDNYSDDLILVALKEAVLNQAYSLKYMDRILLNWERKGIKSEQQALAAIASRRNASISEQEHVSDEPLPKVSLHNWLNPEGEE